MDCGDDLKSIRNIISKFEAMIFEILTSFYHKIIEYIGIELFEIFNNDFWNPHIISSQNNITHKNLNFSKFFDNGF